MTAERIIFPSRFTIQAMMNTSSAFPLNADGRHILPLPSRIVVPELLPAFPGVQSVTFEPLTAYPLTSQVCLRACMISPGS